LQSLLSGTPRPFSLGGSRPPRRDSPRACSCEKKCVHNRATVTRFWPTGRAADIPDARGKAGRPRNITTTNQHPVGYLSHARSMQAGPTTMVITSAWPNSGIPIDSLLPTSRPKPSRPTVTPKLTRPSGQGNDYKGINIDYLAKRFFFVLE